MTTALFALLFIGGFGLAAVLLFRRRQKLAAFLCAVPASIGVLFGAVALFSSPYSGPSPECAEIEREVLAHLRVGDKETRIAEFFASKKWPHASASSLGLHSAEKFIARSWLGEEHVVSVRIEVSQGVITQIQVRDFNRFL